MKLDARNVTELDVALRRIADSGDGVLVNADVLFYLNRAKVAKAIKEARLPALFPNSEYHEHPILMSYGPNESEAIGKLAHYVAKILRGHESSGSSS